LVLAAPLARQGLACVRRGSRPGTRSSGRHLERFPPATPYSQICDHVAGLFDDQPLRRSFLIVDHTGVGEPVLALLRQTGVWARTIPVAVTAASTAVPDWRRQRKVWQELPLSEIPMTSRAAEPGSGAGRMAGCGILQNKSGVLTLTSSPPFSSRCHTAHSLLVRA
jgi:hypothetical protein